MSTFFHRLAVAALLLAPAAGCDSPSDRGPVDPDPYESTQNDGHWPPVNSFPFSEDLDRDTYLAGIAQHGDMVYVIGGAGDDWNVNGKVRVFDLKSRRWSERAPMTIPRYNSGLIVIGDRIEALGGRNESTQTVPDQNQRQTYDIRTNSWTLREQIPDKGFDGTYSTYTTILDGKIYNAATMSSDLARDSMLALIIIDGETVRRTARSLFPRFDEPTLVAAEGKIYAMGRTDVGSNDVNRMYEYNPELDRFVEKSAPRHNERGYANCCYYYGGRIFKLNTYANSANVMEIYTIATDTWTEIPIPYQMRNNAMFRPIVTNPATGEVYFCSTPYIRNGIHFNPGTLTFSTK